MASFPNAAKSFATRSAGQTIQPADLNDLQDEVNAIEDGYLNATARLNAANSTLASLSVPGGSTLATLNVSGLSMLTGAVTFGGGVASTVSFASSVTFAGAVTISGILTAAQQAVPTVQVTQSANQNVNSGGLPNVTGLSWDTESFNTSGMHSTSANSSRLTFAASAGIYLVILNVEWVQNGTGLREIRIMKNDATAVAGLTSASISGDPMAQCVTALVQATSTSDYVTAQVNQSCGSTLSVTNSTTFGTRFSAFKVSA